MRGHGGEPEHEAGPVGEEQGSPPAADRRNEFAPRSCKHQKQSGKVRLG